MYHEDGGPKFSTSGLFLESKSVVLFHCAHNEWYLLIESKETRAMPSEDYGHASC